MGQRLASLRGILSAAAVRRFPRILLVALVAIPGGLIVGEQTASADTNYTVYSHCTSAEGYTGTVRFNITVRATDVLVRDVAYKFSGGVDSEAVEITDSRGTWTDKTFETFYPDVDGAYHYLTTTDYGRPKSQKVSYWFRFKGKHSTYDWEWYCNSSFTL